MRAGEWQGGGREALGDADRGGRRRVGGSMRESVRCDTRD